ncbi:MAG TPA: ABC transporter ATP-binding protein [Candidatus Choladousia intestinigallinarum]|nr:ABC transporter ATP-binding protein [Candidatus Choladousia intestinigallinarum]
MKDYFFYTDEMTVGYDGKPLIKEICIRLQRGEILTLIGPNGAGKSTILKSITRQLKLLGGTVYLDRQSLMKMSGKEAAKRMSVVLTERIRPELMTCQEVVSTGRYPYTGTLGILSREDWEKVWEAMEMVHVTELRERDFSAVSDGQRQRILLARAICQEPELIIMDEPTSFLDIRHKLEFLTILKELVSQKHTAVILSLHELDLAQKISDHVICVQGEWIEKYGTPEEIFTEDYIRQLYGMTKGSYNAAFGCLEMESCKGEPEVFVIGGNGKGIPLYRRLQRQGIPFASGILHKNDVDYQVAKALASSVIGEEPFEAIREETFLEAAAALEKCPKVLCCLDNFGTINQKNRELWERAKILGTAAEEI